MNRFVSSFLAMCLVYNASVAQKNPMNSIEWKVVAELPSKSGHGKSLGFAGPVTGISHGVLIVAGGANFPGGMPWQGGKKEYYNDVYVLQRSADNKFSWLNTPPLYLKQKLAYSGTVTVEDRIICVGGETDTGHTREVFSLQWDPIKKNIVIGELPSLPKVLANMAIANIDKVIYVAGGEDGRNASDLFFRMDLSSSKPEWETLPPLPIAMSHAVGAAQWNGENQCVYVFGGRTKSFSDLSRLYNTVFCYNPAKNSWQQLTNISDGEQSTTISAATAIAHERSFIFLMGGDKGTVFHQIEKINIDTELAKDKNEKKRLQNKKEQLLNDHPGFSKEVLAYNTIEDRWKKIGELPGFGPVTTTAVKWENEIFIPSGEIQPGRRTPQILMGRIIDKYPSRQSKEKKHH